MIVIVDYGMGNLGAIANMLRKIGAEVTVSAAPEAIDSADKLILPGVGAFDSGMANLRERGLEEPLRQAALVRKKPILGICLGMQLFAGRSAEGTSTGLQWIDGEAVRFDFGNRAGSPKIPHMGWNTVMPARDHALIQDAGHEEIRFYFVHSYHVVCRDARDVLATTHYGYDFVSALQRENIFGVQFHPEKSHRFGMTLLRNFAGA